MMIVFHDGIRQTADGRWAGARAGGTSCTSTGGTKLKAGLVQRQMPKMSNMAPKVADHDHDPPRPSKPKSSFIHCHFLHEARSTSHTHTRPSQSARVRRSSVPATSRMRKKRIVRVRVRMCAASEKPKLSPDCQKPKGQS